MTGIHCKSLFYFRLKILKLEERKVWEFIETGVRIEGREAVLTAVGLSVCSRFLFNKKLLGYKR